MAEKTTTDTSLGVQDLTAEERQALEEMSPAMLEHAEAGSLTAQRALSGWLKARRGHPIEDEAKATADAMRNAIESAPKDQPSFLGWFGFPTDMSRTSPFFPKNRRHLKSRPFLRDFVITAAGWGDLTYTGPLLTTYEEDALDALLAILDAMSKHRTVSHDAEGRATFSYHGPARPILLLMGYKAPSSADRAYLVESLELMTTGAVRMANSGGKTKKGKKRPPRKTDMANILSHVGWDDDDKRLDVTVNPFFYEAYCSARVTLMSMTTRAKLTSPIAKALYRFVQSHRAGRCFEGHFLTLADALNMDREQPAKETRRQLKRAITTLISHGVLTSQSKFVSQDIVILDRSPEALPPKKSGEKKKKKITDS